MKSLDFSHPFPRTVYHIFVLMTGVGIAFGITTIAKFLEIKYCVGYFTCLVPFFSVFNLKNLNDPFLNQYIGILGSYLWLQKIKTWKFAWGSKFYLLPTLVAQWVWEIQKTHYIIISCTTGIILFLIHPIGKAAWLYPLYWIIPMIGNKFAHESIVARALTTTFMAHMVGSLIFLYAFPTTAVYWTTLIPKVAIERLTYASLMIGVHYCACILRLSYELGFSLYQARRKA